VDLLAHVLSSSIRISALRNKGEIWLIRRQAKTLEVQLEDFVNENKNLSLNVSKDKVFLQYESLDFQGRHGNLRIFIKVDNALVSCVVWSNNKHSLTIKSTISENLVEMMKTKKKKSLVMSP